MSIATQITRLNNNIEAMKTTKQQIKDAMNNDFDIIANEQIENYDTLIENGLELYKDCIPSEVTNQATEISVTDAMKYSRNKLELFGNTEQASYVGNQLLDVVHPNTPGSGMTYTFENETLTISATNRNYSSITYNITNVYKSNSGERLYFNFENIVASEENGNKVQLNIRKTDNTTQYISLVKPSLAKYSHLIPSDVTNIASVDLGIYSNNTNVAEDSSIVITKPMLQFGTETLDYEPYVGGQPAPNPDYPQDIHVVTGNNSVGVQGKNIANINQSNTNNTQYQNIFFKNNQLKTNTEYTISFTGKPGDKYNIPSGTYGVATATQTITVDNNGIGIAHFTTKTEFTSQSTGILNNAVAGNTLPLTQICLAEGNYQTLPYEPYYHQDYPINLGSLELCKIGDTQDYIYKENGNWYKYDAIKKTILNGSETWRYQSINAANLVNISTNAIQSDLTSSSFKGLSNYFGIEPKAISTATREAMNNTSVEYFYIRINKDRIGVAEGDTGNQIRDKFKAWLENNNTTIYSTYITPASTQITDTTLISQLDAIYEHLQLQKEINNITVTPGDLAPYMKLSYKNYESNLTNE